MENEETKETVEVEATPEVAPSEENTPEVVS